MEAIKAKTAKGEHHDVDDTLLESTSGILGKFCVIADCECNIVRGFAACKQSYKVSAFDSWGDK